MARSDRRSTLQGTCGGKLHAAATEQKGLTFCFYFGINFKKTIMHYNFSINQNHLQKTCPLGTKYCSNITSGLKQN